MARNFSTNQVRQLYVATKYAAVEDGAETGTITLKSVDNGVNKEAYLVYQGADTVLRSDLIPLKNLSYVKAVKKEDLRRPFKSVVVSLSKDVNNGEPVVGQDYILRIAFKQFYGMSEEDQYFKDAAVHVIAGMDAAKFYQKMTDSLTLAFAREVGAHAYTKKDGTVEGSNPYLTFEATADGIKITEKEQPWTLGIESREPVYFDVIPTTIFVNNDDVQWGTTTDATPKKSEVVVGKTGTGNGKDVADLEYFCMGERGDQYRMVGFPNIIPTTYLVKPNEEYNTLDIHYAYTDDGENSYRSEKEITVVSTDAEVINSIVAALNTASGLSIKSLSGTAAGEEGA